MQFLIHLALNFLSEEGQKIGLNEQTAFFELELSALLRYLFDSPFLLEYKNMGWKEQKSKESSERKTIT